LLGEQMFKVEYDNAKIRRQRKSKQRKMKNSVQHQRKNFSTELTAGLRH
jgi:hypothetical protein